MKLKASVTVPASDNDQIVDIELPVDVTIKPVIIVDPEPEPIPPNIPPTVSAGSDITTRLPANKVILKGQVKDVDGLIKSLKWKQENGPAAVIANDTALETEVTLNGGPGEYTFRLTATDDDNDTTSAFMDVIALPEIIVIPPGKINYTELPLTAPEDYVGQSNVVIEKKRYYKAPAAVLYFKNCNDIVIRQCYLGRSGAEGIVFENCNNILIELCAFAYNTSCVYALQSTNIRFVNNYGVNFRVRSGGGRGNMIQFDSSRGTGMIVEGNTAQNFVNESFTEDYISVYNSGGISGNPMMIRKNILLGPDKGVDDKNGSTSGSGIMIGDSGGGDTIVEENTLYCTGNAGMAIAGGINNALRNNKIYSVQTPISNNPLYVWAQNGQDGVAKNAIVTGNFTNWTDKKGGKNNGWNDGNIPNTTFEYGKPITLEQMQLPVWPAEGFFTPAQLAEVRKS